MGAGASIESDVVSEVEARALVGERRWDQAAFDAKKDADGNVSAADLRAAIAAAVASRGDQGEALAAYYYQIEDEEQDEDEDEKRAVIVDFLLSTEHCATEDEATAKCTELFALLSSGDAPAQAAAEPLKKLAAATNLADAGGDSGNIFREADDSGLGGRLIDISEAIETRKKRKAPMI